MLPLRTPSDRPTRSPQTRATSVQGGATRLRSDEADVDDVAVNGDETSVGTPLTGAFHLSATSSNGGVSSPGLVSAQGKKKGQG